MNTFILMAEITQDPELRYLPDNQTPIAEMTVEFAGARPEDPRSSLKVVGWGNLAQEIQSKYHTGDRVVLEGRLSMNTIDRPEGYKEKRAEMTVQRVYRLEGTGLSASVTSTTPGTPSRESQPRSAAPAAKSAPSKVGTTAGSYTAAEPMSDLNQDDIPF
jgi:single-strand DNA-binding protein